MYIRLFPLTVLGAIALVPSVVDAQRPARGVAGAKQAAPGAIDPQLMSLHRDFVAKAEKLASEYERKKSYDQARQVYESMTRLIPDYDAAQQGLKRMLTAQSSQDQQIVQVESDRDWQDTGITLIKGNPVRLGTKGQWTVVHECGPGGLTIPKELDPRNPKIKLGMLIGLIASDPDTNKLKPFPIGTGSEFIAPASGRLLLRMYDVDPSDNKGSISVMVQSTFGK